MRIREPSYRIVAVTAKNVGEVGIYCIKDNKSPGFAAKVEWFRSKINRGLQIQIALDEEGKQVGFIEYLPAELAWRPVRAKRYLFIQCIALFVKEAREKGLGSRLLALCEEDARRNRKTGVCAMSSDGPWIANRSLYMKCGFDIAQRLDRFELMYRRIEQDAAPPEFNDWTKEQVHYKGWHLVYSDQCPWHEKAVSELTQAARDKGINLSVRKLRTPAEAQKAPSGFGTFSLINDGKLLADHYISRTRFENILRTGK
jgi:GNAT superfamily N-acetyltransferase